MIAVAATGGNRQPQSPNGFHIRAASLELRSAQCLPGSGLIAAPARRDICRTVARGEPVPMIDSTTAYCTRDRPPMS